MIPCDIAIVAFQENKNNKEFIILGMIPENQKNRDNLYNIHKNLKYLTKFKIIYGIPNNIEEIKMFHEKFNIPLNIEKKYNSEILAYKKPELFDINCMIEIFETIKPCKKEPIIYSKFISKKVFIILHCSDPIKRGEIIDTCINSINNSECYFYIIGCTVGKNKISSSKLSRLYLISRGVKNTHIYIQDYVNLPECILEAITMIELIISDEKLTLFLCTEKEKMSDLLIMVRKLRFVNLIRKKLYFICN
jgi:hypothetical protein